MKRYIILILLTIIMLFMVCLSSTPQNVRRTIFDAYIGIVDAYNSRGNVTLLIDRLNTAIEYVRMAESNNSTIYFEKAYNIAVEVKNDALKAKMEGEIAYRNYIYSMIIYSAIGVIGIVVTYFLGRRLYWNMWLKIRGKNRVVVRKIRADRKSMMIDEEVKAVILAIIVVASVFAISQIYISGRVVEPFSELGILGSRMKIGDYPRELILGEKAKLYIYVGNHMGKPMYYFVKIKIGNKTTPIDPAPIEPLKVYEKILEDNSTWIFPFQISFNKTGLNYRLIVELWIYNYTTNQIEYHGRWCQLWINVTYPIKP